MKRDEQLFELGKPLVEGMGFALVCVDDLVERGRRVFRFYIDHPRGVVVGDCASVSKELEYLLDSDFDFEGRYVLEVSSPGLDHELKREREYAHFAGRQARLVLREPVAGANVVTGVIAGATGGVVRMSCEDGSELAIALSNVARARLII